MVIGAQIIHEPDLGEASEELCEERMEGEALIRVFITWRQYAYVADRV